MLTDLIQFLNQGWVGASIGALSLAAALLVWWRSRIGPIIAYQSRELSLVGQDTSVFPPEVVVHYKGSAVPRITSSTVVIWNGGRKTVRSTDIVSRDRIRLVFPSRVLNVRVIRTSRGVIAISSTVKSDTVVEVGFEFLDPGDGGVIEVLHSGEPQAPICMGTVIGMPKGPQYWGHVWTASSRRFIYFTFLLVLLGIVSAAIGDTLLGNESEDIHSRSYFLIPSFIVGLLSGMITAIPTYFLWRIRRRPPSSLEVV